MRVITVKKEDEYDVLVKLVEDDAYTIVNIEMDNKTLKAMRDFLMLGKDEDDLVCYCFKGEMLNRWFRLSGDYAYPDDVDIVSVINVDDRYKYFASNAIGFAQLAYDDYRNSDVSVVTQILGVIKDIM